MLGLLAATQAACGDSTNSSAEGTGGSSSDTPDGAGGTADNKDPIGSGSTGNAAGGGGGGAPDGGGAGEGGQGGGPPIVGVLTSKVIPDLTLEEFTEMCDDEVGVVETHAHCGGAVTGPGFSYDSDTDVFTEHTCAGYNTCTGFSCVIDG
jgi:hypothetical protein